MPSLRPNDYMDPNKVSNDFDANKKLLIGLTGKKATGKDTVANMLVKKIELQGMKAITYAFGDPLKTEISKVYGINRDLMNTQEGKLSTVSFKILKTDPRIPILPEAHIVEVDENTVMVDIVLRKLLQWYGTEYRRKQDTNYWTKAIVPYINELFEYYDIIIMTDLRFPNELSTVRHYPRNYVCRLNPHPLYQFTEDSYHISETALDNAIVDDNWFPNFGPFHLKLVANKIMKKVIVPFYSVLYDEPPMKISI